MSKVSSVKSKGKLTKKDLKQDKLVEYAYKAEHFYAEHQKVILGIAAAVALVVLAIIVIRKTMESNRMDRSYQLTLAKMDYGSGRLDQAQGKFQQAVTTLSGSPAGEAKYFLGRIAFEKGDFAGAAREFEEYVKNHSVDKQMDVAAVAGLAASMEAQQKFEDAAAYYMEAAGQYPQTAFAPQALWEAHRIYLNINQKDKALIALRTIRDKYPEATITPQAKRQLELLG